MLDKKTLDVIEAAIVKQRIDVGTELKKYNVLNSIQMHKVVHRGGYFTNGQMADMLSAKLQGLDEILVPLREYKQNAREQQAVTIQRDMPRVRKLMEDKWPLAYDKLKHITDMEEFMVEALTMRKGAARKYMEIIPGKND